MSAVNEPCPLTRVCLSTASAQCESTSPDALDPAQSAALEQGLQDAYELGRKAWPELAVSAESFAGYLGAWPGKDVLPANLAAALHKLCIADLFLVCGCLAKDQAALQGLESTVLSRIPSYIAQLRLPEDELKEVQQLVRTKLLVGSAERQPTLLEYGGRGELANWVRVTAVRTALDWLRSQRAHSNASSRATALHLMIPASEPELEHIKQLYRDDFQRALEDAIATLSNQQRTLLHLYFAGGLRTAQIATLFHVNQSTIVRQLAQARGAIQDEMRRLLRERLRVTSSEYESLLRLLQSQLDLSLRALQGEPESCLQ